MKNERRPGQRRWHGWDTVHTGDVQHSHALLNAETEEVELKCEGNQTVPTAGKGPGRVQRTTRGGTMMTSVEASHVSGPDEFGPLNKCGRCGRRLNPGGTSDCGIVARIVTSHFRWRARVAHRTRLCRACASPVLLFGTEGLVAVFVGYYILSVRGEDARTGQSSGLEGSLGATRFEASVTFRSLTSTSCFLWPCGEGRPLRV